MLQRIIYYKENMKKNSNKVTVENIINLRNLKKSKKKKNNSLYSKNNLIFAERLEKIGINYDELPIFESRFESGNLQLAFYTQNLEDKDNLNNNYNNIIMNNNLNMNDTLEVGISSNSLNFNNSINIINLNNNNSDEIEKFELFLHNDTNTSGYTQWFFFRVSNVKKGKTLNLNIMNFLRKTTKYSNGIKIWVYSRKNFEKNNIGWHHTSEEVKYYKNFLYKLTKGKKDYYYTLSFNYTFNYDNDEVFFANCIPFTYTDLNKDLNIYTKNENDKYIFFDRKKLCSTIIGNEVEYFTINNSSLNSNLTNSDHKQGVVLFARQHPSETVGSWTIKGAIDLLLGDSDEAKYLRDNFVFKIVPMINVDGVICGNTRTSLSGCDLNRRWTNPNIILHPEIFYTKEMIMNFSKKFKIDCIVDFHGHFGAFNSFFYGNYKEDNFSFGKYFPFSCAKKSNVIQFEKSKFKMPKYKKGTGRINLFRELNVENVLTLETSYFGYQNKYFNCDTLQEIGKDICYGILLFHYHSNLAFGVENNLNDFPILKEKVENDEKIINNQFVEYINRKKKEEEEEEEKEKIEEKKEVIEEEVKNDNDSDGMKDESDSESEPSKDNLEESEIMKLMPQSKKIKKIFARNAKRRKVNKRNFLAAQHRSNNINTYNLKKNLNNAGLVSYKSSHFNNTDQLYLPKVNINKNKNNFNKENDVEKIKKDLRTFDIDSSKNKETLKIDYSAKNLLVKMDPHTPNNIRSQKSRFNLKIKLSITFIDEATQTEEIFFQKKWTFFVGMYRIISPKMENPPGNCHLKPIKFNIFKNSNSFINKHDNFFKNSILPPPKSNDVRNNNKNENKILSLIRQSKLHMNYINELKSISNANNKNQVQNKPKEIVLPFGNILPVNNSPIDKFLNKNYKSENEENNNKNRYFSFGFRNKEQKFVENPIIITQNIVLKKIDDKKERNIFY